MADTHKLSIPPVEPEPPDERARGLLLRRRAQLHRRCRFQGAPGGHRCDPRRPAHRRCAARGAEQLHESSFRDGAGREIRRTGMAREPGPVIEPLFRRAFAMEDTSDHFTVVREEMLWHT